MKIDFKIEQDNSVIDDVMKLVDDFVEPSHHSSHHRPHHVEFEVGDDSCFAFLDVLGKAVVDFFSHIFH